MTPQARRERAEQVVTRVCNWYEGHQADSQALRDELIGELLTFAAQEVEQAVAREGEQLIVQMAGVSTAALGWINDPAKEGDYGWSVPYQDVLNLRRKYEQREEALRHEVYRNHEHTEACSACRQSDAALRQGAREGASGL